MAERAKKKKVKWKQFRLGTHSDCDTCLGEEKGDSIKEMPRQSPANYHNIPEEFFEKLHKMLINITSNGTGISIRNNQQVKNRVKKGREI